MNQISLIGRLTADPDTREPRRRPPTSPASAVRTRAR